MVNISRAGNSLFGVSATCKLNAIQETQLSTVARSQAKWPEKQGSVREQEEAFLFVTMADQLPGYDANNPLPPSGEG